tara:strand:+ start:119 stop:679 length:561 start_codon:yes stop_codon:yes gene_type:complete
MDKINLKRIPNYLTIFRVLCIPVIILNIIPQSFFFNWVAVILYIVACISDFLDGYLARKLKVESKLGKFLDPIADKILIISVIFILVAIGKINGFFVYPALIIIIREVLVSGLREFFAKSEISINVSKIAKWKTLIQMFALGFLIIGNDFTLLPNTILVGEIGLLIASLITIYTGYEYFKLHYKSF